MNEHIVNQEYDKNNNLYTVKFTERIRYSSAKDFYQPGWVELVKNGHAHSITTLSVLENDQAVFLVFENQVVACTLFNFGFKEESLSRKNIKVTNIDFTYIMNNFRGRGLSHVLFKYVEKISKINQCYCIRSYVHTNNIEQVKSAEAQGRTIVFYQYEKKVE